MNRKFFCAISVGSRIATSFVVAVALLLSCYNCTQANGAATSRPFSLLLILLLLLLFVFGSGNGFIILETCVIFALSFNALVNLSINAVLFQETEIDRVVSFSFKCFACITLTSSKVIDVGTRLVSLASLMLLSSLPTLSSLAS